MPPNIVASSQQQLPLLPTKHQQPLPSASYYSAIVLPPAPPPPPGPDDTTAMRMTAASSSSSSLPPDPPPPPLVPIVGGGSVTTMSMPSPTSFTAPGSTTATTTTTCRNEVAVSPPPTPTRRCRQHTRRLSTTPRPPFLRKRTGSHTSSVLGSSHHTNNNNNDEDHTPPHGHSSTNNNNNNAANDDNDNDDDAMMMMLDDESLYAKVKTPGEAFHRDLYDFVPGSIPHSAVVALTIGIVCGVSAYIYYTALEWALRSLWRTGPEWLWEAPHPPESSEQHTITGDWLRLWWRWSPLPQLVWMPFVIFLMAVGVGTAVRWLGEPGDLPMTIRCVHENAYVSLDHVLPMVVASQCSILGGASLGPEAPLVAICAALAGGVSHRCFGTTDRNLVRKHTLMGMSGALAAFFGCPLGGSLFALEVNSRFGIEYFEHTVEAVFCGEVCLAVFRALAQLPIGPIWHLTENKLAETDSRHILYGAGLGLVGAAIAALFTKFHFATLAVFQRRGLLHEQNAIPRALCGAVVIAGLGLAFPATLFWGEYEFQTIATLAPTSTLPHVWPATNGGLFELVGLQLPTGPLLSLLVGLAKLIAISFSVCGGYRGGFIFPLFCAGAAFGRAIHSLCTHIPVQLCVLCLAAALNVAVTRTCISTTLILAFLAGEPNAISAILAAALTSLFATAYMPFIKTQVARADIESSIFILDYSAMAMEAATAAAATTGGMHTDDTTAETDPLTPYPVVGIKKTGSSQRPLDYGSSTTTNPTTATVDV